MIATPLPGRLRLSGTLELAGMDTSISRVRVDAIRRAAARVLAIDRERDEVDVWAGLRPCTPDGLPVIGRPFGVEPLVLATGHARKGLSLSPITGRLVAELIAGERAELRSRAAQPRPLSAAASLDRPLNGSSPGVVERAALDAAGPGRILERVARMALSAVEGFPASERLRPYVSRLAIEWMREAPDLRHRSIDGTLAFADISGFTSLTERLSKKGKVGAEEMNDVLDSAFTDLLSVAYDYGAAVIKWGGDATLLLFTGDGHPARACRAAVEMQRTMRSIGRLKTSAGRVTLRMSVGIHTDLFDFFFVGKLHRELVIAGPAADATVAAESSAEAGETVITRATAAALEPSHLGGRRGDGYLLAGAPALEVDRTPSVGDVADIDLERCVPVAISSHLVEGGGEAEHRPLTIAFLRFAGVAELIATAGVDAVADALELTLDTAEGIALEHKVAFFDTDIAAGGGKIMLVSGAPTSSGHDEERMMRSLRAIADSQLPLPLHIGVDRGRLLAADFGPPYRRTYSFKGDAANLAARLMAKAAAGQILATSEVLARSRTEFHVEPLEPFSVKGKSEPVQAFLVGSAAGLRFQRGDAPLVGRDEELRTLLEAVESARRYEGRIVEVVGDPGIGKSRLIQELGENVTPDVFIQVQCDEYEATTPYHPFQGLLRSLLSANGSGDDITPARLRRRVEQAAPHLLPWLPLLAVPSGSSFRTRPKPSLSRASSAGAGSTRSSATCWACCSSGPR